MDLRTLALDPAGGVARAAAFLDGLDHPGRLRALATLDRDGQRGLYDKAAACRPVALEDFVPAAWPDDLPVHHVGRNTLPLPGPFRAFEKRFARPGGRPGVLYGYNEGASRPLIGPGYFVAVATEGRPEWRERGAIVIDYFQVPDGPVPGGWPAVVPNRQGLQRFVFHRTRDFMRRVSEHVTIGAAYRDERALDHYFVLCREP